jgi:Domain of unknown function (DUF4105)
MKLTTNKIATFFILCILVFFQNGYSQIDSCNLRISLLTCSPGEELYSTFGHSAFRVTDSVSNSDIVYNYGTFNFDEPGFYTKFIRGKLLYYLSTEDFEDFIYSYQLEKRGITEQVLNLTCAEKYNMLLLLQTNLMGQNRFYKYDFTFDNCTTRLRDLVEKTTSSQVHFRDVLQKKATFRNLIHKYLDYNDKQWSKLGIDLLLGSRLDKEMKPREVMFLPDYLMKAFDSATIGNRQLVYDKIAVFTTDLSPEKINLFTHPIFIFSCLFLAIVFLSFSNNTSLTRFLFAFDGFIFFMTGLLGIVMIFMWTGTDHYMCKNNYNLLWAWPTNIIAAFYIHSKKQLAKKYFVLYAVLNILLLLCWFFLPQQLNVALIPVVAILIFRSLFCLFYPKKMIYEAGPV